MIYCAKQDKYVEQETECLRCCIFYTAQTDSCDYSNWNPGIKQEKTK